ncbi:MAG: mechanosensitive ion channel domain-containing protein [Marinifilaceae bacterium]
MILASIDFSFDLLKENQYLWNAIHIVSAILLSSFAFYLTRYILRNVLVKVIKNSKTQWDDYLLKRKFFHKLSFIMPAIVLNYYMHFLGDFGVKDTIQNTLSVYLLVLTALLISTLLDATNDIYNSFAVSKSKPIKGFIQVIKITTIVIIAIVIISIFMDKSPKALLTGLGAFAAVIMLVFKDSILGFVAGINISANNMLHIDDWIVMPSSDADGEVFEISLTTVKVRNWDKTIVTIPTYKLMSESFTNWRGMTESGGRRIKRSISLDIQTVKFLTPEQIEKFKEYKLLTKYINETIKRVEGINSNETLDVNKVRLTNIGTFRMYLQEYLNSNILIHDNMTFMVRQLQPTDKGVPLEIYCFSKEQDWKVYEGIQSDIFDHVIAILPEFDLKAFQVLSEIK